MNKERRKRIELVKNKIDNILSIINETKGEIEEIKDEEQDYFDNIPENLQSGERASKSENAIDLLENCFDVCDYIEDYLIELINYLEETQE